MVTEECAHGEGVVECPVKTGIAKEFGQPVRPGLESHHPEAGLLPSPADPARTRFLVFLQVEFQKSWLRAAHDLVPRLLEGHMHALARFGGDLVHCAEAGCEHDDFPQGCPRDRRWRPVPSWCRHRGIGHPRAGDADEAYAHERVKAELEIAGSASHLPPHDQPLPFDLARHHPGTETIHEPPSPDRAQTPSRLAQRSCFVF